MTKSKKSGGYPLDCDFLVVPDFPTAAFIGIRHGREAISPRILLSKSLVPKFLRTGECRHLAFYPLAHVDSVYTLPVGRIRKPYRQLAGIILGLANALGQPLVPRFRFDYREFVIAIFQNVIGLEWFVDCAAKVDRCSIEDFRGLRDQFDMTTDGIAVHGTESDPRALDLMPEERAEHAARLPRPGVFPVAIMVRAKKGAAVSPRILVMILVATRIGVIARAAKKIVLIGIALPIGVVLTTTSGTNLVSVTVPFCVLLAPLTICARERLGRT
jgi:hypothetical protein